ncbi:hypothetical protein SDC9_52018 [bioreactor metagenome]|uniref:Uncharacterized protein n=1 Tax=bioreactor metagenome TaxID=1076179 RepID=A0A644WQ05_9ZZZZ
MFAKSLAHADVENALEVIDSFALTDQFFLTEVISGHGFINGHIVVDMFRNFCRFIGLCIIGWFNVVPREFAESLQTKPCTEHREIEQSFGFLFKCRDLVVHHVHEDQPGFVVLRTFVCHGITALLSQ